MEGQLTIGTYGLGDDNPAKLLLDDLPRSESSRSAVPGSTALLLKRLS
jgi:hypothetical protein